jgi:CheY-like chemotaxis protein
MKTVPRRELQTGPVRVLLVEDEFLLRMDMADTLRGAGFQVIEAASADDAMHFIASGEPIDLLFTDVQMPGALDGLALAERVRARHPDVPVVVSSGSTDVESKASRLGKFVPKPYEPGRIAGMIGEITGLLL